MKNQHYQDEMLVLSKNQSKKYWEKQKEGMGENGQKPVIEPSLLAHCVELVNVGLRNTTRLDDLMWIHGSTKQQEEWQSIIDALSAADSFLRSLSK